MNTLHFSDNAPSSEDLHALALINYGHFTSMQVRAGAVQGLDLHRRRLESANLELFGTALEFEPLREQMRQAVAATPDCTLRATVFSRSFDYRNPEGDWPTAVLVSLSPPSAPRTEGLRLKSFSFLRPLPHLKHVGTFPLFHHRRLARVQGFDDALFADAQGRISEGTVWNLGFWDGGQVIWPEADALRGTAEQMLQSGLETLEVRQSLRPVHIAELKGLRAAFTCNATSVQPIAAIDGATFDPDLQLMGRLRQALAQLPWQPI